MPQRARVMLRLQQLINEHMDELVTAVTREQGKTLADARGDVFRGLGEQLGGARLPPAAAAWCGAALFQTAGACSAPDPLLVPPQRLWNMPRALAQA